MCAKRGSGRRGRSSALLERMPRARSREPTTAASPKRRSAASLRRMCPRPQPNEIAAQPRMVASSTVSPQVECTRTSAAAIHSGMRSVKPSTRTRGSSREARRDTPVQLGVVPAEADDLRDAIDGESRPATAPATSPTPQPPPETSTIPPSCGRSEARAGHRLRVQRNPELGAGEAMHAVDLGRRAGDSADFRDRLGVRDEMDVDAGAGPVVESREIGDRRTDRDLQSSRTPQATEHLGDVGIGADDHVGVDVGDEAQQSARAVARQEDLRRAPRGSALREEPEADVPDQLEAIEHDARRVRAHELDDAADRRQRILGHDLGAGTLRPQLRGEGQRGLVVARPDACGEDQDPRRRARVTQALVRLVDRGRDESPLTGRDSTRRDAPSRERGRRRRRAAARCRTDGSDWLSEPLPRAYGGGCAFDRLRRVPFR